MRRIEDYIVINKQAYKPSDFEEVYIRAYHNGNKPRYEVRISNKNRFIEDIVYKSYVYKDNAEEEAERIEAEITKCLREQERHERQCKDFTEKWHRWKQRDFEDAKAVKRLYPNATKVYRDEDSLCLTICQYSDRGRAYYTEHIIDSLFPSLKRGDSVELNDIIREYEE